MKTKHNTRIRSLKHLVLLGQLNLAVRGPYGPAVKPKPARWMLNLNAQYLYNIMIFGLYVHRNKHER